MPKTICALEQEMHKMPGSRGPLLLKGMPDWGLEQTQEDVPGKSSSRKRKDSNRTGQQPENLGELANS